MQSNDAFAQRSQRALERAQPCQIALAHFAISFSARHRELLHQLAQETIEALLCHALIGAQALAVRLVFTRQPQFRLRTELFERFADLTEPPRDRLIALLPALFRRRVLGLRAAAVLLAVAANEIEELLLLQHREHLLRFGQAPFVDQEIGKLPIRRLLVAQERTLKARVQLRQTLPQTLYRVGRLLAEENRKIAPSQVRQC